MDYQINLDWSAARTLARQGSWVRRINWLDRFLFVTKGDLWWIWTEAKSWVVTSADFGKAEFAATDWTTTWPDQLVCYNPPPDPGPESPPLWNGCKQVGWGGQDGGTWLLPDGSRMISSKLHLEFGATGTATILAAIIAPSGSSISIGGVSIEGSPFAEGKETFNVNPPREFPNVSSLDFDFERSDVWGGGSASIRVCFYPGLSGQPEAGGPVVESIKFKDWPATASKTAIYGQRKVTNPLAVAAKLTLTGNVDDTLFYSLGKGWIQGSAVGNVGGVNLTLVLPAGGSISIGVRNDFGGEMGYDLVATWTL